MRCVGPGLLLARQGQPDDRCTALGGGDREAAPAAADFEQALAGLEVEPVEQQRRSCAAGRPPAFSSRRREPRRAVSHRLVEPGASRNRCRGRNARRCSCAPCAGHCRAADGRRVDPARNGPLARPTLPSGRHWPRTVRTASPDRGSTIRPAAHALYQPTEPEVRKPDQRQPAVEVDDRRRPVAWKPSRRVRAVGKLDLDPAGTSRRSISSRMRCDRPARRAAEQAAAGGEAPVGANQMLTAAGHACLFCARPAIGKTVSERRGRCGVAVEARHVRAGRP